MEQMTKLSKFFLNIGAVFLFTMPSQGAYAHDAALHYLAENQLSPELLPAPPHEGTPAEDQQLSLVRAVQHHVTPRDLAAVRDEQHFRIEHMTMVLGADFNRTNLPATFTLLDHVANDAGNISETDKKYWHTRRPYLVDRHVKLLVDPIDQSPAFPSGHTCLSRVIAEVLGMMMPDQHAALRARADEIAQHRVMAGVHFPNDLTGGRDLAMMVIGALTANDDFNNDLAAARDELLAHAQVGK